jgi:hypothetical protein
MTFNHIRTICLGLLYLVAASMLAGAQSARKRAELLTSIGASGEDVLNTLEDLVFSVQANPDFQQRLIAVRVCSNEPFAVALALGKGLPFAATVKLEKIGIHKSQIYYLRDTKGCPLSKKNLTYTEYWSVPKDSELPGFIDVALASNVSGFTFIRSDAIAEQDPMEVRTSDLQPLDPVSFDKVLEDLLVRMRAHRESVAVIATSFSRLPQDRGLNQQTRYAAKYLRDHGINPRRIYVRPIRAKSTKYPDITFVGGP